MSRTTVIAYGAVMLLAGAAIQAAAQDGRSADPWLAYAVPGPEHELLDAFAGEWSFKLEHDGETLDLDVDYRWTLGGRYLIGEYEGWIDGEHFTARDIIGYDRFRGEFFSHWFDNNSTAGTVSRGQFDPRTRTLKFEGVEDDPEKNLRDQRFEFTYRFLSDDEFAITVLFEEDGRMKERTKAQAVRVR